MKKIKILFTYFLISSKIFAQNNLIQIKSGIILYGTGDFLGNTNSIKFQKISKKSTSIFLEISYSFGSKKFVSDNINFPQLFTYRSNQSYKTNFGLAINILQNKSHILTFNPEISFQKSCKYYNNSYYFVSFDLPKDRQYAYDPPFYNISKSLGYGLGLDYHHNINENINIGVSINSQLYNNKDLDHNLNLELGYNF